MKKNIYILTQNIDYRIGLSISPVIEFKVSKNLSGSSIIGTIVGINYEYFSYSESTYDNIEHSFSLILPSVHNFSLTDFSLRFYVNFLDKTSYAKYEK